MVLPLLVLLYVGGIAVTQGIMTDRKVILLARSLGDIVARGTTITASESTDVFNAASAVLAPYSAATTILRMRVSSVRINNKGTSCVVWSLSPNSGFARSPKDNVDSTVPADLRASTSSFLILSEVQYDYTPIIGASLTGAITMHETLFLKPRQSAEVTSYNQPTASTTVCPDT
ncbi:Flp pilus assembly protein TadG [Labrys wisconsinensis]|uniref:Flp pilus assembly protein TadG n=2 Tax=Labrys wisconsinensis TaxID=425677 RepID=A0ABU0JDR4_9HYPH|nr:Flp pilus assembly protein TadG [Labrys wisconsinensis]